MPAEAFYEPDWRSGKAVATRIARADGEPMGIAGIWTGWKSPAGNIIRSFSIINVNADDHPLMRLFRKPNDEKRMVVSLSETDFQSWHTAPIDRAMELARTCRVPLSAG